MTLCNRITVATRIRPVEDNNTEPLTALSTAVHPPHAIVEIDHYKETKRFLFDYIFEQKSSQTEIYDTVVHPLVTAVLDGYNATIFAYGQTGSGKTYTMGNEFHCDKEKEQTEQKEQIKQKEKKEMLYKEEENEKRGIILRVLENIFSCIDKEKKEKKEATYNVRLSYLEILNEEIHDLLSFSSSLSTCSSTFSSTSSALLSIRETEKGIVVSNLTEEPIESMSMAMALLQKGAARRATASTKMNLYSSRSHAICTLYLDQVVDKEIRTSKFHLVDLAGSERIKKTLAQGDRLKEGIFINRGLLALGNVINALSKRQRKGPLDQSKDLKDAKDHIPYRDAKITRLLQDSLGGNSQTLMIACVSPSRRNLEETINTLRYATRAKKIENQVKRNEGKKVRHDVQALQEKIETLERQIALYEEGEVGRSDEKGPEITFLQQMIQYLELSKEKWKELVQTVVKKGQIEVKDKVKVRENEEYDRVLMAVVSTREGASEGASEGKSPEGKEKGKRQLQVMERKLHIKEQIVMEMEKKGQEKVFEKGEKHTAEISHILQKLKGTYERKVHDLEGKIQVLQREKQGCGQEKEKKIKELEQQIQKVEEEKEKYQQYQNECTRLKEENEKGKGRVSELQKDILLIKKEKVSLQRLLRTESLVHRKETQRQKQANVQLQRTKDLKTYQLQKMEEIYRKQSLVLRQKTKEVSLISQKVRRMTSQMQSQSQAERLQKKKEKERQEKEKEMKEKEGKTGGVTGKGTGGLYRHRTNGPGGGPSSRSLPDSRPPFSSFSSSRIPPPSRMRLPGSSLSSSSSVSEKSSRIISTLRDRIKELEAVVEETRMGKERKERKERKEKKTKARYTIVPDEEYDLIFQEEDDEQETDSDDNDSDYVDLSEVREEKRKEKRKRNSHDNKDKEKEKKRSKRDDEEDKEREVKEKETEEMKKNSNCEGCPCQGKCATKACDCRKEKGYCTDLCQCKREKCKNREHAGKGAGTGTYAEKEDLSASSKEREGQWKEKKEEVEALVLKAPRKEKEKQEKEMKRTVLAETAIHHLQKYIYTKKEKDISRKLKPNLKRKIEKKKEAETKTTHELPMKTQMKTTERKQEYTEVVRLTKMKENTPSKTEFMSKQLANHLL